MALLTPVALAAALVVVLVAGSASPAQAEAVPPQVEPVPAQARMVIDFMDGFYRPHGGQGQLGEPTSDIYRAGPGWARSYQHGRITWDGVSTRGWSILNTPFGAKWDALGGAGSVLGMPAYDQSGPWRCIPSTFDACSGVQEWTFQLFERGTVHSSPSTGTHEVHGQIFQAYYDHADGDLKATWDVMGQPLTDELPTPRRAGAYNHFEFGSIYFSPATGAQSVRGAIRQRWAQQGWENGALGFPVSDELILDGAVQVAQEMRRSDFEGGSVYWRRDTGARIVKGAIREHFVGAGEQLSALGMPTSEEYPVPGAVRQDFTGGSLTYTWASGRITQRLR